METLSKEQKQEVNALDRICHDSSELLLRYSKLLYDTRDKGSALKEHITTGCPNIVKYLKRYRDNLPRGVKSKLRKLENSHWALTVLDLDLAFMPDIWSTDIFLTAVLGWLNWTRKDVTWQDVVQAILVTHSNRSKKASAGSTRFQVTAADVRIALARAQQQEQRSLLSASEVPEVRRAASAAQPSSDSGAPLDHTELGDSLMDSPITKSHAQPLVFEESLLEVDVGMFWNRVTPEEHTIKRRKVNSNNGNSMRTSQMIHSPVHDEHASDSEIDIVRINKGVLEKSHTASKEDIEFATSNANTFEAILNKLDATKTSQMAATTAHTTCSESFATLRQEGKDKLGLEIDGTSEPILQAITSCERDISRLKIMTGAFQDMLGILEANGIDGTDATFERIYGAGVPQRETEEAQQLETRLNSLREYSVKVTNAIDKYNETARRVKETERAHQRARSKLERLTTIFHHVLEAPDVSQFAKWANAGV